LILPEVILDSPPLLKQADYASNYALKLARAANIDPCNIGRELVALMKAACDFADIEMAPLGFIKFTYKADWLAEQVGIILAAGESFGDIEIGRGTKIQLEFVSAPPTRPLDLANGFAAILGSTLANVLCAAGYIVEQEYLIDDDSKHIDLFSLSLWARYQQAFEIDAAIPDDGYHGTYLVGIAQEIIAENGEKFLNLPELEGAKALGQIGIQKMLAQIRRDLELLNVKFDSWFNAESLYREGLVHTVIGMLRDKSFAIEREGETLFVFPGLGDNRDVLIRGDGSLTYFATDVAYHYDKFYRRKFDRVIEVLAIGPGSDHRLARTKAALSALEIDPERLQIIEHQDVRLWRGRDRVQFFRPGGDRITLHEIIESLGADTCRFFLNRPVFRTLDFDLELAGKRSTDNPAYFVQYTYARISSILQSAVEKGIDWSDGRVSLFTSESELSLIRIMLRLPEIVETVALTLEPFYLSQYALDLADAFNRSYEESFNFSGEQALTKARLKLVQAAKLVLTKTLHLLGMTAPGK
jgi:arginyl-tRNA synthetase